MSTQSGIEWTDATWNPTTGCSRVSKGCDNCYAIRMARRFDGLGHGYDGTTRPTDDGLDWTGTVHLNHERLTNPIGWKNPRRVFVDSMSDLFHPAVPDRFLDKVFAAMVAASHHVYQILTKRPKRAVKYLNEDTEKLATRWKSAAKAELADSINPKVPPEHVWLGTSVEDSSVLERLEILQDARASVKFVSFEPLIGPVDNLDLDGVDWVIVGGESGPNSREMKADWVREIRDECVSADVPFFFKQWGDIQKNQKKGRQVDGQEWNELPYGFS